MIACISISLKLAINIQCKFLNCLLTSELLLRSEYNYCEIGRQGIEQLGSPFGCTSCPFVSFRPGISLGYHEHRPRLLSEETEGQYNQRDFLAVQFPGY